MHYTALHEDRQDSNLRLRIVLLVVHVCIGLAAGFGVAAWEARVHHEILTAFHAHSFTVRAAVCEEAPAVTGLWQQNGTRGFLPLTILDTFHLGDVGDWVPGLSCVPPSNIAVWTVFRNVASVSPARVVRFFTLDPLLIGVFGCLLPGVSLLITCLQVESCRKRAHSCA